MLGLYLPILASAGFILLLFKANFGSTRIVQIERFGYKINITNNTVGKAVLAVLSFSFLPAYLTMDFSKLYPSELRMQVYYDRAGIERTLGEFPKEALELAGVTTDMAKAADYYSLLDESRARVTGKTDRYFSSGSELTSEGSVALSIEKIRGFHKYFVSSVEGRLTHRLVRPSGQEEKFITLFSKVPSAGDFLEPSLGDIILRGSIVLFLKFEQTITNYNETDGLQIDHVLVGMTVVSLWPVPEYGDTLYLFQDGSGKLIPVAYAVYY